MTISGENLNYIVFGASLLLMLLDRAGYQLPILSGVIHQLAALLGGNRPPMAVPRPAPPVSPDSDPLADHPIIRQILKELAAIRGAK